MKIFYFCFILFSLISGWCLSSSQVLYSNNFESIQISSQIWMKHNLDVDHYRNGDIIPQVTDSTEWANLKTGAWCYYNNDSTIGKTYGKLYNWYAVNDPRGLAPAGWHIASKSEWYTLIENFERDNYDGSNLIEFGLTSWIDIRAKSNNESGFSASLAGCRCSIGFTLIGKNSIWWSSTENNWTSSWAMSLYYQSIINEGNNSKNCAFSVRCLKD